MQNLKVSRYVLIMVITVATWVAQLYCAGADTAPMLSSPEKTKELELRPEKAFDWGKDEAFQYAKRSGRSQTNWSGLRLVDQKYLGVISKNYSAGNLEGLYGVSFNPTAVEAFRRGFTSDLEAFNKSMKASYAEAMEAEEAARGAEKKANEAK